MKLSILMLALLILINNDYLDADKVLANKNIKTFHLWRFQLFKMQVAELKKKIFELNMKYGEDQKDEDEEKRRAIFEKHLLPHANGTSLLNEFYAGRY